MTNENQDPFDRQPPPLLVVISGPSGSGKDSVVNRMKERHFPFDFVVTATDRKKREAEVHGRDYYFYSTDQFKKMIEADELLEWAVVYGQLKGIPKAHVFQALDSGQDVIMRVDVQGAATVKNEIPQAISIFLMVDSEEELIARLRDRRSESEESLRDRFQEARKEIDRIPEFDYVVFNRRHRLDEAVDAVLAIIQAEHCRSVPQRIIF